MVNIDEMQLGFVPGRDTTDALVIVRQLQDAYITVNKPLHLTFFDIEEAFHCVLRKVLWWALRSFGVDEWAVCVIQGMYQ